MGTGAGATQQSESQVTPDYYVWAFPGSPISIHLTLEAVARLRQCLATATSGGEEPHGLLFGKAETSRVEITDFEQFERDNPSLDFALTPAERERLKEAIRHSHLDSRLPSVIGYFRGKSQGDIRLSQDDLDVIQECFPDPSNVFLVMTQSETGAATAGFFFWDSGSIFTDASFMQFPLDERLLAVTRAPVRLSEAPAAPKKQTIEPEPVIAPAKALPRKRLPRFAWVLGLLAIAGALAVAYIFFFFLPKPQKEVVISRPVLTSPFSLSASRTDKEVAITWNSQLPVLSEARIGVLTIKDGDTQTELPLTKAQLQISKLIYTPRTDRLEISLEVFSPAGQPMKESIMLALTETPAKSRSRLAVSASNPKPLTATLPAARPDTPVEEVTSDSAPKEMRRFIAAPPPRKDTVAPAAIGEVPPPAPVVVGSAGIKAPDFLAPSPLQQQPPKFQETRLSRAAPVQPPKPIRQIRPVVPPNLSAMLKRPVDVQVRVSVDENGKVTSAEPVVPPGTLGQYLGSTAASAARLWTFQPARQGDTAVKGEVLLQFTFGPGK